MTQDACCEKSILYAEGATKENFRFLGYACFIGGDDLFKMGYIANNAQNVINMGKGRERSWLTPISVIIGTTDQAVSWNYDEVKLWMMKYMSYFRLRK